jgi:hypothetical protein
MDAVGSGKDFQIQAVGDKFVVTAMGANGRQVPANLIPGTGNQQPGATILDADMLGEMYERWSNPAMWGYFSHGFHKDRVKMQQDDKKIAETGRHALEAEKIAARGATTAERNAATAEISAGNTAAYYGDLQNRFEETQEAAKATATAKKIDDDLKIVRGRFKGIREGDVEFVEDSPEDKVSQAGLLDKAEALALNIVRKLGLSPEEAYRQALEAMAPAPQASAGD